MSNSNSHEPTKAETIELKTVDDLVTYVAQTLELSNDLMVKHLQTTLAINKALEELVEQVKRFADNQNNEGDSNVK